MRGDRVDGLAARDGADIAADAVRQVGERMQLDDLAGKLIDGADAVGEIVAGVGRLADDLDAHEFAALAAGDDAAAGPAGLAVEHRTGRPRGFLDQRLGGRRADLLIGGEQGRDRRWRSGKPRKGRKHESVDDDAGLHIAAAWS